MNNMFLLPQEARKLELKQKAIRIGTVVFFFISGGLLVWAGNNELASVSTTHIDTAQMREDAIASAGDIITPPPDYAAPRIPELVGTLPNPEEISAAGILVRDAESGGILYSKSPQGEHAMASITKLMTALVLEEMGIPWADVVTIISDDIVDTHVYAGDTYTVEELWLAMLVGSSNKAALTLVDTVAASRTDFIERMNTKAVELGMVHTQFAEPTGLSSDNVSTPSDVILLLDAALRVIPIREALKTEALQVYASERAASHHMWNTNWLLLGWIPHEFYQIIGGKTGYIEASQYNFTSRIITIEGHTIDAVVLGAPDHESRFTILRDIVDAVQDAYVWR
jgi:D-alanyl-D-alanine endopeptidase (penicillin-binding protein 7)